MNLFRTEDQASLNSLIKATRETFDYYLDGAELVKERYAQLFRDIAMERKAYIHRLEDALRASGDLPVMPDPDKEAGQMLINHVASMLKDNYDSDVVEQRINGEKNLAVLVTEAKNVIHKIEHTELLNAFSSHINKTISQLQSL